MSFERNITAVFSCACVIALVYGIHWAVHPPIPTAKAQTPEMRNWWTEVASPVTGQRCFLWQPETSRAPTCFPASDSPVSPTTPIKA